MTWVGLSLCMCIELPMQALFISLSLTWFYITCWHASPECKFKASIKYKHQVLLLPKSSGSLMVKKATVG